MPEVTGIDKLFSVIPKKRFGLFNQYATSQFGFSVYGEEDICLGEAFFGYAEYGVVDFGDGRILSGIYRTDNVTGKTKSYREPYYITKNPRTEAQQAWRQVYADSIVAWQNLTNSQKDVYNQRAKYKPYSGYNLFQKEYLLSHQIVE